LVLYEFAPFLTCNTVVPTPRDVPPLYVPVSDAFGPRILNAASIGVPCESNLFYISIYVHSYTVAELSSVDVRVMFVGLRTLVLLPANAVVLIY
jgi:hypothetical protein